MAAWMLAWTVLILAMLSFTESVWPQTVPRINIVRRVTDLCAACNPLLPSLAV